MAALNSPAEGIVSSMRGIRNSSLRKKMKGGEVQRGWAKEEEAEQWWRRAAYLFLMSIAEEGSNESCPVILPRRRMKEENGLALAT